MSFPPCAFCNAADSADSPAEAANIETTRVVLNSIRAGAIGVGPDGHVCYANTGAGQLLNLPIGELRKLNCTHLFGSLDVVVRSAQTGERIEANVTLPGGSPTMIGCTVSEAKHGDGRGWVVLFQDISSLAELRRQRDRLLHLAVVGEVLPSVLHEVRNPLASVSLLLEVLIEEGFATEIQRDLSTILQEIRRIGLCLEGLTGMHRDLTSPTNEPLDSALRDACQLLQYSAAGRGVRLNCDVAAMPNLPLRASVLRGIAFNLLRNAIDACSNNGNVLLEGTFDTVQQKLFISVRDNGGGMTPEQIERCFDLFFTTKEHGSGVGLPICKHVVERAGGSVSIQSSPGKGTRVSVEIPTKPHPVQPRIDPTG
ncbi:MAG: ATP-binding protein [Polyangiaceae bacterium]|nr:ATP-binding protein [Polyangiaceae bacterium]